MFPHAILLSLILPAAVLAAEPPAVVPTPLPAQPNAVERLRLETQRRDIDRQLMQERMQAPNGAASQRRLGTLRSNRQHIDKALDGK